MYKVTQNLLQIKDNQYFTSKLVQDIRKGMQEKTSLLREVKAEGEEDEIISISSLGVKQPVLAICLISR